MKPSVEQEIERILPFIPTTPPEDTLEIVKARGYLNDQRLLYGCEWVYDKCEGKKVRKVKVVCTSCGGEDYLEYVESGCGRYGATNGFIDPTDGSAVTAGMNCICPCCGRGTTAMHCPSKGQSNILDDGRFLSIHNVDGHLAALSWIIEKRVRKDGTVFYKSRMHEGIVVIGKTIVRVRGFFKYMISMTWLDHWEYTKRYDNQLESFHPEAVINASYEETDGTECEKSGLVPYLKTQGAGALYPAEYLKVWLKRPNIENLVTAGYEHIVNEAISDATGYFKGYSRQNFEMPMVEKVLNLKKVRPIDILGIDPEDVPIAKSAGIRKLAFYRDVKKRFGVKLDSLQLEFCRKQVFDNLWELIDLGEKNGHDVKIVRLINYLEKQRDLQTEEYDKTLVDSRHMRDYWDMLYKVYRGLPEELVYPRDLRAAHDDIQKRIEDEENAEVNERIIARVGELSRFNFYDEETMLFIRPAGSYGEFKKEGKNLNHCVARYAQAHSTGETSIFFIRRIDEPDKPYYTLELHIKDARTSVAQNRGKGNCARTEEVQLFENKWLDYVKEIISKENKRNGKRNRKSGNAERIGA